MYLRFGDPYAEENEIERQEFRMNTIITARMGEVTHPIDLMKSIHIELTDKGRKLRI